VAALKKIGLTEAVHEAPLKELERVEKKPSLVEMSAAFARKLSAMGDPAKAMPADKAYIDSLYQD